MPAAVPGGRDHLNNVEVVDAPAAPGLWQARVTGFKIPQEPQKFSLIGGLFTLFAIDPPTICRLHPLLCGKIVPRRDVCQRHPKLCETRIGFPAPNRIRVTFLEPRQKIALPLDRICRYAIVQAGPGSAAHCREYDLTLSTSMRVEIYGSDGQRVMRDHSAALSKRVRFDARQGERYFLVLGPGRGTRLDQTYEIGLQVQQ